MLGSNVQDGYTFGYGHPILCEVIEPFDPTTSVGRQALLENPQTECIDVLDEILETFKSDDRIVESVLTLGRTRKVRRSQTCLQER